MWPFTPSVIGCDSMSDDQPAQADWTLDQRSYNLGSVGAFAEMVGAGVKELALSAPLTPSEMDVFLPHAREVAERHGVDVYRETDFFVTDLFAASLTDGLEVLLIYRGETLPKYLALKDQKQTLLEAGIYDGSARTDLARRFGKMLSYTDDRITELLDQNR